MHLDPAAKSTTTSRPSPSEALLATVLSAIPIFATLVLRARTNATFFTLARDPWTTEKTAPYLGFLSQISIFFWASAAAICIFSGHILSQAATTGRTKHFLRAAGLFTLLMGIDDIFGIHDHFFPNVLGVSEKPVFAAYAIFAAWLLWKHWPVIRASKWPLLAASFTAFGTSLIIDKLDYPMEYRIFFEDSAKLIGIVLWMVYLGSVAAHAISSRIIQTAASSSTSPSKTLSNT